MRKNLGHFAMPALRSVCTCDLSLSLVSQRHAKLHKKFHWRRRMVDGWPACIHYVSFFEYLEKIELYCSKENHNLGIF